MPDQAPELIDTGKGLTVRFRGRFLYSPSDPAGAVERRIAGRSYPERTLYILPSPLLFHGIDLLLERIDETSHVLCVETDQALMAFSAPYFRGPLETDGRISYVRSDSPSAVLGYMEKLNPRRFRRTVLLPLTGGYSLDPKRYTAISEAVGGEINRLWQDTMTRSQMGRRWMRNIFTNLRFHSPGGPGLPRTGKPAAVAGAGESLEASLPLLRGIRNEVWLLAVDTALPILLASGIVPDAVCAVEAQQANVYDFLRPDLSAGPGFEEGAEGRRAGVDSSAEPFLLCDLSSYPGVIRAAREGGAFRTGDTRCTGGDPADSRDRDGGSGMNGGGSPRSREIGYFFSAFERLAVFERLENHGLLPQEVPPLGSIGITSLSLAARITDGPVLYTGLDFAYTPGKTHGRGAPSHTALLSTSSRVTGHTQYPVTALRPWIRVPGREHGTVNTDYVLYSYATKLAELVGADERFVDIGGRGVGHPGRTARTEEEIRRILDEAKRPGGSPAAVENRNGRARDEAPSAVSSDGAGAGPGPRRNDVGIAGRSERITNFFRGEYALLERVMETGRRYLAVDQGPEAAREMRRVLEEADYLYLHFPDPPPLPLEDPNFVKRALLSAEEYLYRIRPLAASLEAGSLERGAP
jgi:hypothetical protein